MDATPARRPLVAGNWKMHGLKASVSELDRIIQGAKLCRGRVEVWICPPATLICSFAGTAMGSDVAIGAQDCHAEKAGAFTGELSAEILADAGAKGVIVGHSERRQHHGETDAHVRAKIEGVWRARLIPIACIGETEGERLEGRTLTVIDRQLAHSLPDRIEQDRLVIAYEPVWAIGTGRVPIAADVAEVHGLVRERLSERFGEVGRGIRVLYGGSINAKNARALFSIPGVDGGLVGGASLKAEDFLGVLSAYA
jgi:triosephosphate isomerase (TIM)